MTDAERTNMRKTTVGFVFQKFNLLPNLTARDNIAVARFIAGPRRAARADRSFRKRSSCWASRTGWTTSRPRFPAASSSASPSPAPSSTSPPSCWRTSPPATSTPRIPRAVLDVLRGLNDRLGQTILMITHNPEAAAYGHHIVHMRDGRIVERT